MKQEAQHENVFDLTSPSTMKEPSRRVSPKIEQDEDEDEIRQLKEENVLLQDAVRDVSLTLDNKFSEIDKLKEDLKEANKKVEGIDKLQRELRRRTRRWRKLIS